jgi:hypothetical protein
MKGTIGFAGTVSVPLLMLIFSPGGTVQVV